MSSNCFDELPPELILLLPQFLSTGSLNATIMTSRRLREVLQPELESRLTPELGWELLPWAAGTKPHIVRKVVWYNEYQPLRLAAMNEDLEITRLLHGGALLLNRGASLEHIRRAPSQLGSPSQLDAVKIFLDKGA
ncbi:hypothetical protein B0H17DRAFT_1197041 [Mycena rosella]|uniref:F-box domain-containing protein n=1 Tax=Mycena rosella TaxID=1033263 RepID=A0AAD7DRI2_MYCRO|nr:hypothetical protein B0H17DRAFT_1197041 [Mycena rosella]